MIRSLATVLVLLALSSHLVAQAEMARDNCELLVRVVAGDERSVQGQLRVQVLSPQGVLASVQTNGGDPAQFRVTNGKTYRLIVSGMGIETVTTPYFEINALEMNHTEIVHVKPVPQKPEEKSTEGSPTISVSEMNIPRNASAEMNKGMDEYSKGDLKKAEGHFEKAIAAYPRYARAYDMLGVIAIKSSNRAQARDLFSKAIQADGTFWPASLDLARMDLQDQDYARSESVLAKVIALNPTMPEAVALLATAEFANQEYDKALADVERTHALRNHEPFAEVHLMAAKVLRMQNHLDAAMLQFQLFLKEKPDSPEAESARQALALLQARP